MLTHSATAARAIDDPYFDGVASRRDLRTIGVDAHAIDAQVAAGRWQRVGPAVVLHNADLTTSQHRRLCLINCGPRSALTSFTAAEEWGLRRCNRPEVHVLMAAGAERPDRRHPLLRDLVIHRVRDWSAVERGRAGRLHALAPALLRAAASYPSAQPGCALLAAAVQQRLLRPTELRAALASAPKLRHRHALGLATADIEQGADALSEIDFVRLCRRFRLPMPTHQAIRRMPDGRRRYLDIEWRLANGRVIGVEVDGAHHMWIENWIADQKRQNRIVIDGTLVLRYASIVVRDEPEFVAAELAEVLA